MSLEDSMSTLAASNLKLAESMNRYATVMENIAAGNPDRVVVANVTTEARTGGSVDGAEKPKGTRRTKAQIDADAKAEADALRADTKTEELDPFAEDEPAATTKKEVTLDDIRGLLMAVKDKDRDAAIKILKAVGAETISKIDAKSFDKVIALAAKEGVTID
jgi:hypothetical protein